MPEAFFKRNRCEMVTEETDRFLPSNLLIKEPCQTQISDYQLVMIIIYVILNRIIVTVVILYKLT
jgi:hypothetical protein